MLGRKSKHVGQWMVRWYLQTTIVFAEYFSISISLATGRILFKANICQLQTVRQLAGAIGSLMGQSHKIKHGRKVEKA